MEKWGFSFQSAGGHPASIFRVPADWQPRHRDSRGPFDTRQEAVEKLGFDPAEAWTIPTRREAEAQNRAR